MSLNFHSKEATSNLLKKEIRYPLPEIIQKYIELTVDANRKMINDYITNISQGGLQLVVSEPLTHRMEHYISISSRRSPEDLIIKIEISYRNEDNEKFIAGTSIIEMPDHLSFNFSKNLMDLIYSL